MTPEERIELLETIFYYVDIQIINKAADLSGSDFEKAVEHVLAFGAFEAEKQNKTKRNLRNKFNRWTLAPRHPVCKRPDRQHCREEAALGECFLAWVQGAFCCDVDYRIRGVCQSREP